MSIQLAPDTPQATQLGALFESFRSTAYLDIAGVCTIGFGHTGPDVHMGMTCTRAQAIDTLNNDMTTDRNMVWRLVSDVATMNDQLAAMTDLCFNIGIGNFRQSSVLRLHRAGQYDAAADAFLLWDKAHVDGVLQEVDGLLRRRKAERLMYLSQDWGSYVASGVV